MVIKLQINKPKIEARFTLKDVEELFSIDNWDEFYKKNETKFWKDNLDIYKWVVFPLITKDEHFYRCVIHPTVNVDAGDKKYQFPCKNVHFSELVSHCIFYAPEEHKQYIIEKLKLK